MSNYEKVVGCFSLVFEHNSSVKYIKGLIESYYEPLVEEGIVLYFKESPRECALLIVNQDTSEISMLLKDLDYE